MHCHSLSPLAVLVCIVLLRVVQASPLFNPTLNHGPCDLGLSPGWWDWNATAGSRWRVAEWCPPLENLLLPAASNASAKTLVMTLGDSQDWNTVKAYCDFLHQNTTALIIGPGKKPHGAESMGWCENNTTSKGTGGIELGSKYITGVHLEGPYVNDVGSNFSVRIKIAANQSFTKFGRQPDVIFLSACLWDTKRRITFDRSMLFKAAEYPHSFVQSWSHNFTLFVRAVRQEFPEAMLIYRTQPLVSLDLIWRHLGTWHNFRQLGQAGKQVALRHGLHVIDVYSMMFGEWPQQYLQKDGYHVVDAGNLEVMNIALNMLAAHRRKLGALE